jgi:hypothetical protein
MQLSLWRFFMMVFSSGCDTITSLFGKDDSKETKTDESLGRVIQKGSFRSFQKVTRIKSAN